jgi:hypothetical protein
MRNKFSLRSLKSHMAVPIFWFIRTDTFLRRIRIGSGGKRLGLCGVYEGWCGKELPTS